MSTIEPNELFFDKYLDASSRLYDLEQFQEHAEGFLRREREYFEEEAHPDLEREFLPLFAETFPPILHSSIIISTIIFLEQELRVFSGALIDALGLKIRFNDLAGSIIERFRTLTTKIADLRVDEDSAFRWEDLVGLYELRNCLVHAQGQLCEFQRSSTVRSFSARHGTPTCNDDAVVVDAASSALALDIVSSFVETVYAAALERFPGHNRPLRRSPKAA